MRRCLLLVVVLLVGFAPSPFPKTQRRPRPENLLVGTWKGNYQIVITPTEMHYSQGYEYELRLDPSASPPAYNIRGIGSQNGGWEFCGIYRLEGDTLTLSYNSGTSSRPTSFSGQGAGIVEVYKRIGR